jgi:hypothetical protein
MEDLDFMDPDVVGEVSYVEEPFAFAGDDDPDDPLHPSLCEFEDKQDRVQYFEGYASTETPGWKGETKFICLCVEFNGATNHYLATSCSKDAHQVQNRHLRMPEASCGRTYRQHYATE